MKNAIIYTRVSTSKQSKNGESSQVQEKSCRDFCKSHDYQVLGVFNERFTGTKGTRPKIQEAIEFIQNSELKIDYIVVLKIDRVSRGGIEIHNKFKEQFKKIGVQLKDVHGVISTDKNVLDIKGVDTEKYSWAVSNEGQYAENITVMMAQDERNKILQRMLGQSIRNGQRGYKVRDANYGYKNTKVFTESGRKTIQVENPEESKFIKKMYELKARGDLSDHEIVNEVNNLGFKSRAKIKWNSEKTKVIGKIGELPLEAEQMQRYIKNTIYAGIVQEEWTGGKAIKAPYKGLITIDTWNKANRGKQKIITNEIGEVEVEYYNGKNQIEAPILKRPKKYNPEYMFAKVLKCPECEGNLTAEKARGKSGKYYFYYQCRGKKGAKHKNYSLHRDATNESILETFREARFDKNSINLFEEISENVYKERSKEHGEKMENIKRRITALQIEERAIIESTDKLITYPELLDRKYEELKEIKHTIKKTKQELNNKINTLGLDRFKKCSRKILEHPEILALQKEKPEIIQLGFELLFGGKIVFENIKSRTLLNEQLMALNTKKEFQLNGNSSDNRKWWVIRGSNPGPSP